MAAAASSSSSSASTEDKYVKEIKTLKTRIEVLEKENTALKKSLYDLSARYNLVATRAAAAPFPLDLLESMDVAAAEGPIDAAKLPVGVVVEQHENATDLKRTGREQRQFYMKYELKGHAGAVYAAQFSHCGRFLASGSFDKTVRIWDAVGTQKELFVLKRHTLNVSDLSWSTDSSELLSGAYDQTCRVWDVDSGKCVETFETEGFVQCVTMNPANGIGESKNRSFFYGTTRNVLGMVDRRQQEAAIVIRNDSMVNSIVSFRDGSHVVSGDSMGFIKTWDIRTGKCVQSVVNEPTKKPISHIALCPTGNADDEPRYLGVNSYDNVMRVYDRGIMPPQTQPRLIETFRGYKNKNWPIKSSFYRSKDANISPVKRSSSNDDIYNTDSITDSTSTEKDRPTESGIWLATGSADPYVYVYNIGGQEGGGDLMQRLEGHTDRVYAASFHHTEPILASCSADYSVKIWYVNYKKKK